MKSNSWLMRVGDELAQAWIIAIKDVQAYYMTPTTVLWALLKLILAMSTLSGGHPGTTTAHPPARVQTRPPQVRPPFPLPGT